MTNHLKRGSSGHLLRNAAGHLVIECGSVEPTCDIDCAVLASAYTILGVGSLMGCSACDASSWTAWNGALEQVGSSCQWMLNTASSVAGKAPSFSLGIWIDCATDHANGVGIWFNEATCQWELAITCRTATEYRVIWAGTKSVEFSPAGVYTRVCGCDETPTLTVV